MARDWRIVKYIGSAASYTDPVAGTGTWTTGQSQTVDEQQADVLISNYLNFQDMGSADVRWSPSGALVGPNGEYAINSVCGLTANSQSAATKNTTAIQLSLSYGGDVVLATPGLYYINSTLTIGDFTRLRLANGVKIKLADAANCTMIKTAAINAAEATVTITSSSQVATVTWTAHGKSVGDFVSITGANETDYCGVWRVESVPTADTFTYYLDVGSATTPATGTIKARAATVGAAIVGGEWDANLSGQTFSSDSTEKHAILFAYCALPEIATRVRNSFKYAISVQNATSPYIHDCELQTTQVGADGCHLTGPIRGNAVIERITGRTGDDIVGLTCSDTSPWNITSGDMTKVVIRDVHLVNGLHSTVKIDGCASGYVFKSIEIDGLSGSSVDPCLYALVSAGATRVNRLTINNVSFRPLTAGVSVIQTDNSTIIDNLSVSNVKATFPAGSASSVVRAQSTSTITHLEMRNIEATLTAGGSALVDMASTATLGQVVVDGFRCSSNTGGYVARIDGALTAITLSNGHVDTGGNVLSIASTCSTTPIVRILNNYEGAAVGGVSFAASAVLESRNWRHNSGTAALTVTAGTCEWHGEVHANTHISISGGTLKPNGAGLKIPTASATYAIGYSYFDTTLNKARVGGATAWETITSV